MKKSSEESIHREMLLKILFQEYLPGVRLVESKIAESLGVSRTPVRNVLRRLIAEGLLDQREGEGVWVPHLTGEDMRHVFHARLLLERDATMLATKCAGKEDVALLRNILEQEREHYRSGDPEVFLFNEMLHENIARISGNPYLLRLFPQLFWRSELYCFFFDKFYVPVDSSRKLLRDPDLSHSCQGHAELVEAMAEGDPEKAGAFMAKHIRTTFDDLIGRVSRGGGPPSAEL